jgi:hypothetical protein
MVIILFSYQTLAGYKLIPFVIIERGSRYILGNLAGSEAIKAFKRSMNARGVLRLEHNIDLIL